MRGSISNLWFRVNFRLTAIADPEVADRSHVLHAKRVINKTRVVGTEICYAILNVEVFTVLTVDSVSRVISRGEFDFIAPKLFHANLSSMLSNFLRS